MTNPNRDCPTNLLREPLEGVAIRHGYRSKKFKAAYVRAYSINFTKSPKKLKKIVIFGNRNWLEVYYYYLPYDQGQ